MLQRQLRPKPELKSQQFLFIQKISKFDGIFQLSKKFLIGNLHDLDDFSGIMSNSKATDKICTSDILNTHN